MTTERKSVPTITRQKNYHEIKEIYSNLIILHVATASQTAFRFVVLNKTAYHLFIPFPKKQKCFSGFHLRFENEQKRSSIIKTTLSSDQLANKVRVAFGRLSTPKVSLSGNPKGKNKRMISALTKDNPRNGALFYNQYNFKSRQNRQ